MVLLRYILASTNRLTIHPPRTRIQEPFVFIQKFLPNALWHKFVPLLQPGGLELANLTQQTLYGQDGLTWLVVFWRCGTSTWSGSWKEEDHGSKTPVAGTDVWCSLKLTIANLAISTTAVSRLTTLFPPPVQIQKYLRSTSLKWTITEENMLTEGNTRIISYCFL